MQRILSLIVAVVACMFSTAYAAETTDNVEFAEKNYDFGTVKADSSPVVHEFVFTNNSSEPVIILSASASCGCTRPKYTHEPVKPGKQGKITVTFLPKGQQGYISKDVKVRLKQADKKARRVTLRITGNVTPE